MGGTQRRSLGVAAALAALVACAPTTVSPMVMRLGPGQPDRSLMQVGLRSGPRLSAPVAASANPGRSFAGDASPLDLDQWSLAYDLALTLPAGERTAFHLGAQGEFYYPFPLPGYGLYAGVSHYVGSPRFGFAPALVVRGATNFGLDGIGGSGTVLGVEATTSFSYSPEENFSVGLVPFLGFHQAFSTGQNASALYFGGVLALSIPLDATNRLEVSGGFGRVKVGGTPSWNVPIVGVRDGF